jgi:hypothetical protein
MKRTTVIAAVVAFGLGGLVGALAFWHKADIAFALPHVRFWG